MLNNELFLNNFSRIRKFKIYRAIVTHFILFFWDQLILFALLRYINIYSEAHLIYKNFLMNLFQNQLFLCPPPTYTLESLRTLLSQHSNEKTYFTDLSSLNVLQQRFHSSFSKHLFNSHHGQVFPCLKQIPLGIQSFGYTT